MSSVFRCISLGPREHSTQTLGLPSMKDSQAKKGNIGLHRCLLPCLDPALLHSQMLGIIYDPAQILPRVGGTQNVLKRVGK